MSRARTHRVLAVRPPSSVVLTAVTTKSARTPLVMKVFEPLTR